MFFGLILFNTDKGMQLDYTVKWNGESETTSSPIK